MFCGTCQRASASTRAQVEHLHARVPISTHTHAYACTCAQARTYASVHARARIGAHAHLRAYLQTGTHRHTHKSTRPGLMQPCVQKCAGYPSQPAYRGWQPGPACVPRILVVSAFFSDAAPHSTISPGRSHRRLRRNNAHCKTIMLWSERPCTLKTEDFGLRSLVCNHMFQTAEPPPRRRRA